MTAKQIFKGTISLSDKSQIGLPLGKSYYKPTPKFWRNVGDGLLLVGTLVSIMGAVVSFPPAVIVIAASAGAIGKYITNCVSDK